MAQVLLGARSEHQWLRICYARLGYLFPYLPHQPSYHKRLKAAAPLLAAVIDHLARQCPSWHDPVRLIDAAPVPCAASQETVRRSELAGWAAYWVLPGAFAVVLGPEAVPGHRPELDAGGLVPGQSENRGTGSGCRTAGPRRPNRSLRPGLILIGDKGFTGRDFESLVTGGFGLPLVRPDRHDEAPRHRSIGWIRQWIESVNDTLKGQLDLERHGSRTTAGVYARITQRLLAMAATIRNNWATGAPTKRSLTAYDH